MNPLSPAIHRAVEAIISVLTDKLAGLYLYGSSVSGGLRPNSDLDFLAVVNSGLSEAERHELVRVLLPISGPSATAELVRPVELTVVVLSDVVPWQYPPRNEFVYGEWLRTQLEAGQISVPGPDPDLAVVLASVLDRSVNLAGPRARALLDPVPFRDIRTAIAESLHGLVQGLIGDERNVILTLARMWMTLVTREIVPKDIAAARMLPHVPEQHARTLEKARRAYVGEEKDNWALYRGQAESFVEFSSQAIKRLLHASTAPD